MTHVIRCDSLLTEHLTQLSIFFFPDYPITNAVWLILQSHSLLNNRLSHPGQNLTAVSSSLIIIRPQTFFTRWESSERAIGSPNVCLHLSCTELKSIKFVNNICSKCCKASLILIPICSTCHTHSETTAYRNLKRNRANFILGRLSKTFYQAIIDVVNTLQNFKKIKFLTQQSVMSAV